MTELLATTTAYELAEWMALEIEEHKHQNLNNLLAKADAARKRRG